MANITVSTTTNGTTQVDGYFNETNSLTITVTLDNTGNADFDTFKNGAIYLQLAWAENGNVPTTFNDFAETGQSSFGGTVSAEITVTNSNLANTNGTPDQDNFALKVVIMNKTLNPDTTTTKDITFEGSNSYIKYDVTDAYLTSYSYPGSNFNTQKVVYSLSENLADAFSSTVKFTGTSGTDNGTIHSYTLGSQAAEEKQTGGTRTVTLSGQLSNGDLVHDNYYSLTFTLRDAAGNSRTTTYTSLYYDTESATVTGVTSSKASGTYGIGEDIPFTVSFSEAVTTSGGNIALSFNSGATETITVSSSSEGSGTYTVSEGETTSGAALSVSSPLSSTGSVEDAAGNAMSGSDFDIPNGQNINNSKTIIIDGVRPTISSITSSSPSGSYSAGENIDVTITFSEDVTLSSGSNLIITLETGSTDRTVSISAADIVSTNSASGTYTVQDGDETSDLAAISVTLDGGSLTDGAGNAVTNFNIPSNQNISDSKDIVIETTAPTISQVSSTSSDGTYGIDDEVNITITFSEAVTLSGGNLVITLETGDTDQQVVISSINNSTTASGTYTVQENDQSTDLTVTDISLSAGTITDAAGNTMSDFTIPGAANLDDLKDIIIEATRPTISSVTSTTSDDTYGIGDNINISVTFSEAVNLSAGSLVITLDNNQTVSISSISSDLTVSGTYTVQEGDESSDLNVQNITVSGGTLTDDAGNAMTKFTIPTGQNLADAKALVIDGVRPTVDNISSTTVNGKYKIGDDVNLTVTFSESVSLVGGDLVIELETGTTDRTVSVSPFSSSTTASGTYTVQEGDSNGDLSVNQVYLTAGYIEDAAGNTMSSFSIPGGSNLDDQKEIVVDGIVPTDFQVGAITAAGGTVVSDYWNSTNTSLKVTVPLETTDTSLVDGTVQLQAKIGANSYADLGASTSLVQSDVTSGSKTITVQASGTADTDFEEITGFDEGAVVSIRAILTDASGNSKTGTASNTTITIDQTAATIQGISSTSANTYYKIGDDVNVKVTFSDAVTLTSGNLQITLETGATDRVLSVSSVSNTTTVSTTYTVQSGEESSDLAVKSLAVSGGSLIDVAGNPITDFSIPSGSNLDDASEIIIDGIVPSDFTVGSVTTAGGTVQSGYWNGTNTSVSIVTPIDNDASLVNGTIQLRASVDGGSYENLGDAETIALSDLNDNKTITITEAAFEGLTNFTDGSVVTVAAIITDVAGNSTTGSPSATTLTVDQTDPASFTVGDVTPLGSPVVNGYWNSTNTGAQVRIPLASDATLVNGKIRLQAKVGSGGSWQNIGSFVTLKDGDLTTGYKDVTADSGGTDSLDIRELTGFDDGYRLYFRAILYDAAGNQTTGTESASTLLIDETVPSITGVTSDSQNGLYKAGDTVNVTVNFSENVSLDNGSVNVLLNVAQTVSNTTVSGTDQIAFDYAVQENDETGQLTVNTISVSGGNLSDAAGNVISDFTIPAGSNLSDNSALQIDGVYPADFSVGTVKTVGGTVVDEYWNGTNTGLEVVVPVDNDASLVDGSLQLRASVDGGSYENMGSSVTLVTGDLGTNKTLSVTATDFEGITGFTDGVEITITAVMTDKAGNATTGTASSTTVKVDQTAPQADTVGVVIASGGNVVSGYWNGTNSGIVVTVPLDKNDGSLSGGSVRLQAKAGITSSFENIAAKASIQDANILDGYIDVTADSGGTDSVDVREITGFSNEKLLYFRAVVEDIAGNSAIYTKSDSSLLVDETRPYVLSVQSPDANVAYNAGDTITIQTLINEDVTITTPPTGDPPTITMDIGGVGASALYNSGSGTDTLTFQYVVAENHSSDDLDYVSTSPFQLNGSTIRDLAGNEFKTTLPDPGSSGSLSDNNDIIIDTEAPTATITLSDRLVNKENTPLVTVTFSEQMADAPQIYVDYAGDAVQDTTDMFQVDNVTWTYTLTIPDSNDGVATISIIGTDNAGNALTDANTTGRKLLRLDNTAPEFTNMTPDTGSYVNHTQVAYTIVENSSKLDSASITWTPIPSGSSISSVLEGTELDVTVHALGTLTNDPSLVDGTLYKITFFGQDSAGNKVTTVVDSVTYDTTAPTVELTYSHYFASKDTTVTITATFSEPVLPTPTISIDYAGIGNDITNANMTMGADSKVWTYQALIPDGNNGIASVTINATDLATNAVPSANVSNSDTLVVDNSLPTAQFAYENLSQPKLTNLGKSQDTIRITVSFNDVMRSSPAPTISVEYADSTTDSFVDFPNNGSANGDSTWFFDIVLPDSAKNSGNMIVTTSAKDRAGNPVALMIDNDIFVVDNTPPDDFTTGTVFPYGNNPVPGWINATTEEIQITVPIVSPGIDTSIFNGGSVAIEMYNMARGTDWVTIGTADSIQNFGNITFLRSIDEITAQLVPGSSLIVGDSLLTRAIITDRVGNRTIGDSSASVLTYDPNPLQQGTITGGNVLTSDTLISTDIITIEWSAFEEQDPEKESGLDYYEIAVEQIGDTAINAFVDWLDIGTDENHTFNLPLEHMKQYRLHLRGIDRAGNISDTLASDTLLRLNSAPQIVAIDSLNLYEDLPFSDSIQVVDPDVNTQLGDEFRYYVRTTRTIGEPAQDSISVDSLTGAITWTPTQDDTGSYSIRVIVRDNWGFADTLQFPLLVHAVNDTPVVQFLPPADHITFVEDHTDTVRIDLTPYAKDVDNDSSELSWQVVILDTTTTPGFPTGRVIVGPGTSATMANYLKNLYSPKPFISKQEKINPSLLLDIISEVASPKITVTIDTVGGSTYATFDSDSNYYGDNHRLIFYVSDPYGAVGKDTMLLTILPRNDPPVWSDIPLIEVLENDSVKMDFADYVVDVDDTLLTINVTPLTNGAYMAISPSSYQARSYGDTVIFKPRELWSDSALIRVVAVDAQGASDSTTFVIDVIRVPRPQLSVAVLQNNAFTNFFEIVITDTMRKVVDLTLKVQNQIVSLDTIADYTFVGQHSFVSPGTYTFDVSAKGVVGDTSITRQVGMTLAKTGASWYGSSPDGRFRIQGSSGAVTFDQPLLIVDSTMFGDLFNDLASYRIGNENMHFRKPVEVSIQGLNDDMALYQRVNGVHWKELPSMTVNGSIMTYTQDMGYFRLGPKTLIVPGVTSLHQNYPNPFNPYTNIIYDVGFIEGPRQKVNISVYNILGQHMRTLVNDYKEIGRYTVRWAGKDDNGVNIASGIYFIRLTTNQGKIQTRKVMLLR
ncbi:MAG: T9SS type A sorting domain-containing protein [FCB group bacterium]|nr:T9SS type A sorting domain-containing protein [FCB group bacterium]